MTNPDPYADTRMTGGVPPPMRAISGVMGLPLGYSLQLSSSLRLCHSERTNAPSKPPAAQVPQRRAPSVGARAVWHHLPGLGRMLRLLPQRLHVDLPRGPQGPLLI
jgi:hypothetical protein